MGRDILVTYINNQIDINLRIPLLLFYGAGGGGGGGAGAPGGTGGADGCP
jgi:hypothetical protein